MAAQNCIVGAILDEFPNVKIIAEEDDAEKKQDKRPDPSLVSNYTLNPFGSLRCPEDLVDIKPEQVLEIIQQLTEVVWTNFFPFQIIL